MRLRSLLWVPLVLALASATVFATPVTVSYAVSGHNLFVDSAAPGFDCCNNSMVGTLTFVLPTSDLLGGDPQHAVYVKPSAELHMQFFNDAEQPILSVDWLAPLIATIDLFPNDPSGPYALWGMTVLNINGEARARFSAQEFGWTNDSADNLLRVGQGAHPEFQFSTDNYTVSGPGHINLISVPEPRISMLLYGIGFGAAAVGRLRRRQ